MDLKILTKSVTSIWNRDAGSASAVQPPFKTGEFPIQAMSALSYINGNHDVDSKPKWVRVLHDGYMKNGLVPVAVSLYPIPILDLSSWVFLKTNSGKYIALKKAVEPTIKDGKVFY